jgi:hypothetical protein
LIPGEPEFAEYRALLDALTSNDVGPLLRFPGRAVATFCELATEWRTPPRFGVLAGLADRAVAESLTTCALYFNWSVREGDLSRMYPGARLLLQICSGVEREERGIQSLSYLDEMDLLLRNVPRETMQRFARTRFAEDESLSLEGLWLGGGYGLS